MFCPYGTPMNPGRWLLPLLLLSGCAAAPPPAEAGRATPSFQHLAVRDDGIVTRNAIPLRVSAEPSFRATTASHRIAEFGGHPFEVSLAALLGEGEAVMVHAERVTDGSGASNYDNLPRAGWPDGRFGLRTMCAAIDHATVESEHDLGFLARNGWNPEGSLALEQFLANTPAHDQEVVVSLVARVPGCADAAQVQAALRRLRDRVRVTAE